MRPSSTTRPSAMRTGDSPDALGAAAAAGAMLPLAASFAAPAPSIWELVGLAWRTGAVGALGELRAACEGVEARLRGSNKERGRRGHFFSGQHYM